MSTTNVTKPNKYKTSNTTSPSAGTSQNCNGEPNSNKIVKSTMTVFQTTLLTNLSDANITQKWKPLPPAPSRRLELGLTLPLPPTTDDCPLE
mmetsp:Transcript_4432/g.11104  ORF Transcript_4432/g.11104 Transcript_4432/m.11104 type:complete len:92 (+) Transcript_4432:2-277(+)